MLNADQLAEAMTNGASGWMVASVAAVLPILWAFTLAMHFGRPYIVRFLQKLTLRFGADVWWLSYVLTRDGLMVVTLGLSLIFLMPNLYLKQGLPITAPLASLVLFWALVVKLVGDADDDPKAFSAVSILLVIASFLYIVPQVYGMEAADQNLFGKGVANPLISISNLAVARPLLWVTIGLFAITAGLLFIRFMLKLGAVDDEGDAAEDFAKAA